jgi:hypothetical protein
VNVVVQLRVEEADIAVSPDSFTILLATGHTLDTVLTICSDGGGCVLSCSLYVNPAVEWLTVGDTSGIVEPGECDTVDVYFNTAGLSLETFNAALAITSNDPDEPTVEVPVQLTVTGIEEVRVSMPMPVRFDLSQNRPNPVRFQTTVFYQLPREVYVLVQVYDRTGKLVKTLVNDIQEAGYKDVIWNGQDECGRTIPSGIYFYRLRAGDFTSTKKMVLLR